MKRIPPTLVRHATRPGLVGPLLLGLACGVAAADTGLRWEALSAQQRYILQRYQARWAGLDAAARAALVARADALDAASQGRAAASGGASADDADGDASDDDGQGVASAAPAARASATRERARRYSTRLSAMEAVLSAHSSKLKRRLRETPGLTLAERRDILERWAGLSSRERIELVERYATNPADSRELDLQKALREGRLKPEDIKQGLASGRLKPGDLSNAIGAGRLSASDMRDALGSDRAAARDIESAARTGQAPSPTSTGVAPPVSEGSGLAPVAEVPSAATGSAPSP